MSASSVSFVGRVWLAWVCSFRVLFDGRFAARVAELNRAEAERASLPPAAPVPVVPSVAVAPSVRTEEGALQLLALLQREGRFVDFVEQEVASFSDADIGAAARVVHQGCRKALHAHARVVSIRNEAEGARVTLDSASADVKLVGNVAGSAPFRGVLRHRGWRVEELSLPKRVGAYDATVVAAAELEL
ncbi:MAG: DUF2760 domain-containing protein [Polyangiaceae bacterium]